MQFYTNELLKNLKEFLFQKRLWPADITAFGEQNSEMKLDLAHPQAASVMSTPRLLIQPTDSMWAAPQLMQEHWVQQLMVTCETGELVSIITKTGGFEAINPTETYQNVETLQHLIHKQTSEQVIKLFGTALDITGITPSQSQGLLKGASQMCKFMIL